MVVTDRFHCITGTNHPIQKCLSGDALQCLLNLTVMWMLKVIGSCDSARILADRQYFLACIYNFFLQIFLINLVKLRWWSKTQGRNTALGNNVNLSVFYMLNYRWIVIKNGLRGCDLTKKNVKGYVGWLVGWLVIEVEHLYSALEQSINAVPARALLRTNHINAKDM